MILVCSDILALLFTVLAVPLLVLVLCLRVDFCGDRGVACEPAAFSDISDDWNWSVCDCVCVAMLISVRDSRIAFCTDKC